jgi:hypothetical protein
MERSRFVLHKGREIYVLDCADCSAGMVHDIIDECAKQVQARPEKSVRTLTIASGGKFDNDTISKLKELTKGNSPYVEKAALVGISGLYKVLVTAVMMFSKREFSMFDDKAAALDYLAG